MPDIKKNLGLLAVLVVSTVLMIHFYLLYFADLLANSTNYFFGLAVFPILVGVVIGSIGAFYISRKTSTRFGSYYYLPTFCALAATLPVVYVLLMMS